MLLVLVLACNYDLPHANALKAVIGTVTAALSIVLFWGEGDIHMAEGLLMAAGSIAGGVAGAILSSNVRAHVWVYRLLLLTMGLEIIQLAIRYLGGLV